MEILEYDDFLQQEKERSSAGSVCLVVHLLIQEVKSGDGIPPVKMYYCFKPVILWFA